MFSWLRIYIQHLIVFWVFLYIGFLWFFIFYAAYIKAITTINERWFLFIYAMLKKIYTQSVLHESQIL